MTTKTITRNAADLAAGDTLANGSQVARISRTTAAGVVHITWTSGQTTSYIRADRAYRVKA